MLKYCRQLGTALYYGSRSQYSILLGIIRILITMKFFDIVSVNLDCWNIFLNNCIAYMPIMWTLIPCTTKIEHICTAYMQIGRPTLMYRRSTLFWKFIITVYKTVFLIWIDRQSYKNLRSCFDLKYLAWVKRQLIHKGNVIAHIRCVWSNVWIIFSIFIWIRIYLLVLYFLCFGIAWWIEICSWSIFVCKDIIRWEEHVLFP